MWPNQMNGALDQEHIPTYLYLSSVNIISQSPVNKKIKGMIWHFKMFCNWCSLKTGLDLNMTIGWLACCLGAGGRVPVAGHQLRPRQVQSHPQGGRRYQTTRGHAPAAHRGRHRHGRSIHAVRHGGRRRYLGEEKRNIRSSISGEARYYDYDFLKVAWMLHFCFAHRWLFNSASRSN